MASATRTHYDLLEVPSDADQAAIKAAYNKLRRPLHPDMPGGSATLFGMVAEAYEVLGDPQKRAECTTGTSRRAGIGAPTTKQATEAARATEAAHATERTRLETLLRLAEAQAQGRPTPETGDAHADEVAQYVELLRRMDLNREQARRRERSARTPPGIGWPLRTVRASRHVPPAGRATAAPQHRATHCAWCCRWLARYFWGRSCLTSGWTASASAAPPPRSTLVVEGVVGGSLRPSGLATRRLLAATSSPAATRCPGCAFEMLRPSAQRGVWSRR